MRVRSQYVFFLLMLSAFAGNAQIDLSPYSRFGLGILQNPSSTRNFTMGGIGAGSWDFTSINKLNPASYADVRLTTFDVSSQIGWKELSSSQRTNRFLNGSFHNAAMAWRTNKKLTLVAGLAPVTGTGYSILIPDTLYADTATIPYNTAYTANGGLNEFYLGFGTTLLKRIRIGANLPLAFGSTTYRWYSGFTNGTRSTNIERRINLHGFVPRIGIQADLPLRFNRTVDKVEVNASGVRFEQSEIKRLDQDLRQVERKEAKLKQGEAAIARKKALADAKKAELIAQKDALQAQRTLTEKEREKYENKERVFNNRKKKLDLQAAARKKKLSERRKVIQKMKGKAETEIVRLQKDSDRIRNDSLQRYVKAKDSLNLRLGLTVDPPSSLTGSSLTWYSNGVVKDTMEQTENGKASIPMRISGGFTIGKTDKWQAGADFTLQQWQNFSWFASTYPLRNSWALHAGGEWIPELYSIRAFRRIAWRAGAWYESSMLKVNNTPINQIGVVIGAGIPMQRIIPDVSGKVHFSRVNVGLAFGLQGTTDNGLLRERFVQLRLGVNLNDRWFVKRILE